MPLLFADAAQLAIGWGIVVGGFLIGGALVCFPWKRLRPKTDD